MCIRDRYRYLQKEYYVVLLDFQTFDNDKFENGNVFSAAFINSFLRSLKRNTLSPELEDAIKNILHSTDYTDKYFSLKELFEQLSDCLLYTSQAVLNHASDIFVVAGLPVSYRANGRICREKEEKLMPPQTKECVEELYKLAGGRDIRVLEEKGDDDFSFAVPGLSRFRVSAYKQRGALSAVIRVITFELPEPNEIGIPDPVMSFYNLSKGLVLVTGPAGSGKSTTLACLVDKICLLYTSPLLPGSSVHRMLLLPFHPG